jgi:hypothetical protein
MDLDLSSEITEILNSEIGTNATLTTASPSGTADVRVIFTKDYDPTDVGDTVKWSSYSFMAKGLPSDFTDAKQNDTLAVGGVDYNIEDKYETDDGWVYLPLTTSN